MNYIYQNNKIKTFDFSHLTVFDVCSGPYIIKAELQGFKALYFCGIDDDLWEFMFNTGRFTMPISSLVSDGQTLLRNKGVDFGDIKTKTWQDLTSAIETVRRLHPDSISVQAKSSPIDVEVIQPDDQSVQFNSMLA